MLIDLHTHSNISDGTQSPAELMAAAAQSGVDVLALTDHDQTTGWDQARQAAERLGIGFIPGMEITCHSEQGVSVHLLSYLHDPLYQPLLQVLNVTRTARESRAQRIVGLLSQDFPISWELVQEHTQPGSTVGRPHIADALVTAGVVINRDEAFSSMLSTRSEYYVSHPAVKALDAVRLVREAGGVPVFAHPMASARGRVVPPEVFEQLIDAGLAGLEIHHRDNSVAGKKFLQALADRHDLIVTGSSDYHGTGKPNRLGENSTDPEMLQRILSEGSGSLASM